MFARHTDNQAPPTSTSTSTSSPSRAPVDDLLEENTRKLELINLIPSRQQPQQPNLVGNELGAGFYPSWPHPRAAPDSPLADLLAARQQTGRAEQPPSQQAVGGVMSPLVLALTGLSLVVSALLVLLVLAGSVGRRRSRSPLDK